MRIPVNLASEPFRRDRAMLVASGAVGALMAVVLAMLVSLALSERALMADSLAETERIEGELRRLNAEQGRLTAILRKPENAEVLDRSLFLNTLIYRKGISWTRIFADLESMTPYNVRIISIRPQLDPRNRVFLDMVIGAEGTGPVLDFLRKLEGSELFGATAVENSLAPTQTEPLFRYRISVSYARQL
jgi:type IV pilus assembly protein PilN